jgi:hypothetical protein
MTAAATSLASQALATEVKKKVRERGLVLWLDAEGQYSALVNALSSAAFDFPYPVVACRGSYLELMLALEPYGSGLEPEHVLVHLPGLNKENVKDTPVYELYKAGISFEKKLETLVREAAKGVAPPGEVDEFLREGDATLEGADRWLASLGDQPRDELDLLLGALGVDDVALGLFTSDARIVRHLPKGAAAILTFLQKGLGISPEFRRFVLGDLALGPAAFASLVSRWLMAVEFVIDLKEPPKHPELLPLAQLGPLVKDCRRLVRRARDEHPDLYEELAAELQEQLKEELGAHGAGALGSIDTFSFEEQATRRAALAALAAGDWESAHAFATQRTPDECFWVRRAPRLGRTWELIQLAAGVGRAFAAGDRALGRCASLDEAVDRYTSELCTVDRLHRLFEQRCHAGLTSELEDHHRLLEARQAVRRGYRAWADATSRAFHQLCLSHGALPSSEYRQRALYEQVVQPLIEQGRRVAFCVVDAMRFEMAHGLAEELKREKLTLSLRGRLAELPTVTEMGMNALAPVARQGRLTVALHHGKLQGLRAGEYTVSTPSDRVRCMGERSVGTAALDLELEAFLDLSLPELEQRIGQHTRLVVVRSRELDEAGEHRLHLGTFEHTLALLKSAVHLLGKAGMDSIVIASDHGFLLQDTTTEAVSFGDDKRLPCRRHALVEERSGMADVLELPLSALEYDSEAERYLVFRPDTAVWKTQEKVAPFVHGGNSLQERVIPVLVIDHGRRRGKTASRYEVLARPEPAQLGRQRLRLTVRLRGDGAASLGIHTAKAISLALRVPRHPDLAVRLLSASPPATLREGRLAVPPNQSDALVEFELEGDVEEQVRIEVYHPDEVEDVTPMLVEGFFEVTRNRRLGKPKPSDPPARRSARPADPADTARAWQDLIDDPADRRVFAIIEERRSINEAELAVVLGSPRLVRSFARRFDGLVQRVPFEVEIRTVNGMKSYTRKD